MGPCRALLVVVLLAACGVPGSGAIDGGGDDGGSLADGGGDDGGSLADGGTLADGGGATDGGSDGGSPVDGGRDGGVTVCESLGLSSIAFTSGGSGTRRGDLAADFTLPLLSGASFPLGAAWTGCHVYVFLTDAILSNGQGSPPIWENEEDLGELTSRSPPNALYFFVSTLATDTEARAALRAMQTRIDDFLDTLTTSEADEWRSRLHVVATRAGALAGPLPTLLSKAGAQGFVIDRAQRLRGVGAFADVDRPDPSLGFPFRGNLGYAANEVVAANAAAVREQALAQDGATVVPLWRGELVTGSAEIEATLPAANAMAAFDTAKVEVSLACPEPDAPEIGNCGAWDYLARLSHLEAANGTDGGDSADGGTATARELARFITSYHRESRWVVDATPALVPLSSGGVHRFRLELAPPWNPQPTVAHVTLRLSNRGRGMRPTRLVPLFAGGDFGAHYNDGRLPVTAIIPLTARRIELWALLTGHGSGSGQCAEFCNHRHEVSVNGHVHVREFPEAGSLAGCLNAIDEGVTANQAGTWWFGRGGWCPGQQVDPWVVDVTTEAPAGTTAVVTYQGLLNGAAPPDGAGTIELESQLVIYE